jgi:hypothetical protein
MKNLKTLSHGYFFGSIWSSFLLLIMAAIFSCSPTTAVTPTINNQQTANNDAVISILTDEIDDLVSTAFNTNTTLNSAGDGRLEAITDDRLTCSGISITFSGVDPVDEAFGKMTISFPQGGCVDLKGNVRKGTLIVEWTGARWYRTGSAHTITLSNYSVNDIGITGKRTLTVASFNYLSKYSYTVIWDIVADHVMTWPDGSSATVSVTKTRQWDHAAGSETYTYTNPPANFGNYAMQGTNRHGKDFNISITSPLVYYYYSCIKISKNYMPVVGVKVLTNTTDNVVMTINYGATTQCDNVYVLTINNGSISLHAKNNSSDD